MSSDIMQTPQPDPRLKDLEPLIGSWRLVGHLAGSDGEPITGRTSFTWFPGAFFIQQVAEINFLGTLIVSQEIIGYDQSTDTFRSSVYSNLSPEPLPYEWDVHGDDLTIKVAYGPLDTKFSGSLSEFSGEWKPNPGADPLANVAYAIRSERIND